MGIRATAPNGSRQYRPFSKALLGGILSIVTIIAGFAMLSPNGRSSEPAGEIITLEPGTFEMPAAGQLQSGDRKFQLADITPVGKQEKCTRSGRTYMCGFYGWQSWETLLRGKRLQCTVTGRSSDHELVRCHVVGDAPIEAAHDLGLWLIQQGFAKALAAAPETYHAAEADARQRRSGIHG